MSQSIASQATVHTGIWTDWTNGRVRGLTLTVPLSQGAVLTAFLAIFVRVASGHFWDIFCYTVFHLRSTTDARDGLYHQQQALLRNNLSDNRAIWQFSSIAWRWNGKAKRPLLRTLPLICSAVLWFLAFTIAGIFSSKVTTTGSVALVKGPVCGTWTSLNPDATLNKEYFTYISERASWVLSNFKTAAAYSSSCYTFNDTQNGLQQPNCQAYGRRLVDWSINTNVSCPFDRGMCVDDLAVSFDTGYVDSHLDLGINGPKEDRVAFRNVLQCAPITTEGFTSPAMRYNATGLSPESYEPGFSSAIYVGYEYGPSNYGSPSYTFVYNNATFGQQFGDNILSPAYLIDIEIAYLDLANDSYFLPINSLSRTDGDVYLMFIMNDDLVFVDEVNDPIFKANVSSLVTVDGLSDGQLTYTNLTYYKTPAPVSVLGCVNQLQWCNPSLGSDHNHSCSGMVGMLRPQVDNLKYTARQTALKRRIEYNLEFSTLSAGVSGLGSDALLSSAITAQSQASAPVPDDQWIREIDHWFGMQFISLQLHTVQYATGTGSESWNKYLTRPSSDDAEWMCSAQMMQRSDYASFSMLGVILILVFGVFAVLINAALDPLVRLIRSTKENRVLKDTWRQHHVLQFQSALYESLGMGAWNRDDQVPVTTGHEKFGLPTMGVLNKVGYDETSSTEEPKSRPTETKNPHHRTYSAESAFLLDVPLSTEPIVWSNDIGDVDDRPHLSSL